MNVVTIGIQTIMPDTATSQEQLQPESQGYSDNAALVASAVARQGPPPPGMGQLVDKTV